MVVTIMESVFILSGETGEALVEHQCAGSRHGASAGASCVENLWQEILRTEGLSLAGGAKSDSYQNKTMKEVPTVIALPQCYVFHVRSDPLIFGCSTQREVRDRA